jgi:hypothetical protein
MRFSYFCCDVRISGFESSSNFVEEQEQGVFPKTLKHVGHCQFF